MKLILALCVVIAVGESVNLPSNFTTCNRSLPKLKFQKCLLQAARDGVKQLGQPYPELDTPSLNPLFIEKIVLDTRKPLINVNCTLTNCTFYGLLNTQIINFNFDFENKIIVLDAVFPFLHSECYYKKEGYILGIPINGEGPSSMNFTSFIWHFDLTYEEEKINNKTYVKPINSNFEGKPRNVHMNISNVLGNNQEVTDIVANKIINDNWSILYDAVEGEYLEKAKETWLEIFHEWFLKVSLEESFDN